MKPGRRFIFKNANADHVRCLRCSFLYWPMLRRSLLASIIVGTVLTAINQGTIIFDFSWDPALYWKIPLTFCVPFCVATYGALSNSRA